MVFVLSGVPNTKICDNFATMGMCSGSLGVWRCPLGRSQTGVYSPNHRYFGKDVSDTDRLRPEGLYDRGKTLGHPHTLNPDQVGRALRLCGLSRLFINLAQSQFDYTHGCR